MLPLSSETRTGAKALIRGVTSDADQCVELHRVMLSCTLFRGRTVVGLTDTLHGVDFLLGNDLAGSRVAA